jgi:hypothetical protein
MRSEANEGSGGASAGAVSAAGRGKSPVLIV